jgi:cytochrome c peroxidase
MKRNYIWILAGFLFVAACSYDTVFRSSVLDQKLETLIKSASPSGQIDHFILPDHSEYTQIPQDPKNPMNASKVALGQYLFFETGIGLDAVKGAGMETYSCATCHVPSLGFKPGAIQGIADGGIGFAGERSVHPDYEESELDAQGIRALSVLNVAFVTNTFWNGQFGGNDINEGTESLWNKEELTEVNHLGFSGIESQNIEGIVSHRMHMDEELAEELAYNVLFDLAFPSYKKEERYTKETASLAMSAYLRSLITDQAPFQDWLKGDDQALTEQQKRGGILFFSKANCYSCHNGPSFNSMNFYALGVKDMYQTGGVFTSVDDRRNLGRGGFTKQEEDMYKFKVPQLYNLKHAPFYFHGSSKENIDEVIEYFDEAIPENADVPNEQISNKFKPLYLTDQEKEDLKAFLEDALYDPYIDRYVPPYVKSGNCFPNNDPVSQLTLGCN